MPSAWCTRSFQWGVKSEKENSSDQREHQLGGYPHHGNRFYSYAALGVAIPSRTQLADWKITAPVITFTVYARVESVQSGGRKLENRWTRTQYCRLITNLVHKSAKDVGAIPKAPLQHPHIEVDVYRRRAIDFDNLVRGLKPYIDGLKKSKIILDDRWSVAGSWTVDQIRAGEDESERIVFRIRERDEPVAWNKKKTKKKRSRRLKK